MAIFITHNGNVMRPEEVVMISRITGAGCFWEYTVHLRGGISVRCTYDNIRDAEQSKSGLMTDIAKNT